MANSIKLSSITSQNCISYLQQDHISNYTDVKLTSILDGYSVFVNRIMLASLSNYFRHEEILKEDHEEITKVAHTQEFFSYLPCLKKLYSPCRHLLKPYCLRYYNELK